MSHSLTVHFYLLYAMVEMIYSFSVDCDHIPTTLTVVHGTKLAIGPVDAYINASAIGHISAQDSLRYRFLLEEERSGDHDWIKLIDPELKLECEFDYHLPSEVGDRTLPKECKGLYHTLRREYRLELKMSKDKMIGEITLYIEVDFFDSNRYRMELAQSNDSFLRCPVAGPMELVVTRFRQDPALPSKVVASATGAIVGLALIVGVALLVTRHLKTVAQIERAQLEKLKPPSTGSRLFATAMDIEHFDSAHKFWKPITGVMEANLWAKYKRRSKSKKKSKVTETEINHLLDHTRSSSSAQRSSQNTATYNWTLVRLAVTGNEKKSSTLLEYIPQISAVESQNSKTSQKLE